MGSDETRRECAVPWPASRGSQPIITSAPTGANERERAFVAVSVAARDRERRRRRRRIGAVGLVLLVGSVVTSAAALRAVHQQHLAESQAIAITAKNEMSVNPLLGLLLAIAAANKAPTDEATDALRRALPEVYERLTIPVSGGSQFAALSRDGHMTWPRELRSGHALGRGKRSTSFLDPGQASGAAASQFEAAALSPFRGLVASGRTTTPMSGPRRVGYFEEPAAPAGTGEEFR